MVKDFNIKSKLSNNLSKLPKYLFAEIDEMKNEMISKGVDVIDLSIGDPDIPTPEPIIEALYDGAKIQQIIDILLMLV